MTEDVGRQVGITLYGMVREGLPGEVKLEQRPGESKGMSYMDIGGVSQLGGIVSTQILRKMGLVYSRNSHKGSME